MKLTTNVAHTTAPQGKSVQDLARWLAWGVIKHGNIWATSSKAVTACRALLTCHAERCKTFILMSRRGDVCSYGHPAMAMYAFVQSIHPHPDIRSVYGNKGRFCACYCSATQSGGHVSLYVQVLLLNVTCFPVPSVGAWQGFLCMYYCIHCALVLPHDFAERCILLCTVCAGSCILLRTV